MGPKRRASASTDDGLSGTSRRPRRAKTVLYNQATICNELVEIIKNYKTVDGRILSDCMTRLPKKRTNSDYYDVIKSPIDLIKIQQKLKSEEYDEIDQLTEDVELLVNNTKLYYKSDEQEHKDAVQLWSVYQTSKAQLIAAAFGESSAETKSHDPVVQSKCKQLLDAVKKLKNGDRLLCEFFMKLPDKKELPIYYETVKNPIDLDTICQKLNDCVYRSVTDLEHDLNLMIKNAMDFNEPGSTIYRDAETIKLMMSAVMSDIMLASPNITRADKTKAKGLSGQSNQSDPMDCDTETEESGADDDEDNEDEEEGDASMLSVGEEELAVGNPFWLLFKAVATYTDEFGMPTVKPFQTLPNRRWFPDYYEDIANPISLTQIKRKIKRRQYNSLNEMANDLNLMFENAKQYNTDESIIFKNAIEMQSMMWEKKKEIEQGISKVDQDVQTPIKLPSTRGRAGRPRGGGTSSRGAKTPGASTASPLIQQSEESSDSVPVARRGKRGRSRLQAFDGEKSLKKRLLAIYNSVYDCQDEDGRSLIDPFIELPSKDDYPEYYEYITEPIDMNIIEQKIQSDKYESEKDLIVDLKLMFNNARTFNEDGSHIYKDANVLEKAMKKKVMELSITDEPEGAIVKRTFATVNSSLTDKLTDLYETIKAYQDQHHRVLSTPFVKLPSKAEYPEYYEVIKKPFDLTRIMQKIQAGSYENMESMMNDVAQMFDNAMVFNEPESLLYKDAGVLLNEFLKRYYCLDDFSQYTVPNVSDDVQSLLTALYQATVSHQDEEGRCYIDSLTELDSLAKNGLTFSQIGRNLKGHRYRRLDRFQEDIFSVCEHIRKESRVDSQAYDDAVELQKFFITLRDKLCKNGEYFSSPAISFTQRHLVKSVEEETKRKSVEEGAEEAEESESCKVKDGIQNEAELSGTLYQVGDFVYVSSKEKGLEPHIMNIEKLWKDPKGEMWIFGGWFYRPRETFHLATRKFLNQEVFRTDVFDSIPLSVVIGKCYVMYVKEYFRNKPEGFADKDIYVCESKYSKKLKSFKKMKVWNTVVTVNSKIAVVPRVVPLVPTRVASVFAEKESAPVQEDKSSSQYSLIDKEKKDVTMEISDGLPGFMYYEQVLAVTGWHKLGDCVYVMNPVGGSHLIARIDKISKDPSGALSFSGPVFLRPEAVEHNPARLFYEKELFLSSHDSQFMMASIVGKCCVLWSRDFFTLRPTEYQEKDVFICESKYTKADGETTMRKLSKGFKTPSVSTDVCDDEIIYFNKKVNQRKVASPILLKLCAESYVLDDDDEDDDDTNDKSGTPLLPSVLSGMDAGSYVPPSVSPAASDAIKKRKRKSHHITSFQLFANDIRRSVQDENPKAPFGVISQLVAAKWRCQPKATVLMYKEKAAKLQAEARLKAEAAEKLAAASSQFPPNTPPPPPSNFVGPMTQFRPEMFQQQHMGAGMAMQPQMHHPAVGQNNPQLIYQQQYPYQAPAATMPPLLPQQASRPSESQQWQEHGQIRPPVPTHMYGAQQMAPHLPMQAYAQQPVTGSPMHRPSPVNSPDMIYPQQSFNANQTYHPLAGQPAPNNNMPVVQRPASPKFVSVDLPPQKVAHSDIYLKYIGGLRPDNPVKVSNWERELIPDIIEPPPHSQLPVGWLAKGPGAHPSMLHALHSLRDVLLKDTLHLQRTYQL